MTKQQRDQVVAEVRRIAERIDNLERRIAALTARIDTTERTAGTR